jgi:asparagine synthase (glutamine-hydrolysing)
LLAYLPSILLRQDKMSMAASVESRVPILGNRLIDLALTASIGSMIHGRTGKIPLRALANKKLPPIIGSRRKMGFGLPLSSWLKESKSLRVNIEKLSSTKAHVAPYLDCRVIQNLVNAHLQAKEDNTEMLWILMALETWLGVLGDWRTGRQTFARSTT